MTDKPWMVGGVAIPADLRPFNSDELATLNDYYDDVDEQDMFEEELVIVCLLKTVHALQVTK